MEFEYGCQITNKYSFLNESDVEDPSELLAKAPKELPKETKPAAPAKGAAKPAPVGKPADAKGKQSTGKDGKKEPLKQQTDNSKPARQQKLPVGMAPKATSNDQAARDGKENTSNRGNQSQGDNQRPRNFENRRPKTEGGDNFQRRERRPPRQGEEGQDRPPRRPRPQVEGEGGQGEEGVAERRGPRGGNFSGPRSGGNFRRGENRNRRPEGQEHATTREFDRHSGSDKTGVKAVDKKEGAGKGNWGTAEDELAAVQETNTEETAEQTGNTGDWAAQVEENEENRKNEEEEAQTTMLTLDEYRKLKQQIENKNSFNIRKPGEGEDQAKWGKSYVLKKKVDEEENDEEEEEDQDEPQVDPKKNIINQLIQIKFNEPAKKFDRRDQPRPPRRRENAEQPASGEQPAERQFADAPKRGGGQNNQRPRRGPQGEGKPQFSKGPRANVPRIQDEQDFPSLSKA